MTAERTMSMDSLHPRPLAPIPPSRNPSRFPSPLSPNVARFPTPPSPNIARFPRPATPGGSRRPSPPQSASFTNPNPSRFPTPPSPNFSRFPMPPPPLQSSPQRRPGTAGSVASARYPTPPMSSNPSSYRPTTPHATRSNPNLPRYPTPPHSLHPSFQSTRSATMPNMPNMPSRPPAVLTPEQESLAKRLRGSSLANEEDALRAEAEAQRNYANLEAEMVMARKFRKDNARETKKLEVQMREVREKLAALRGSWESARIAMETLRAREREMAVLRQGLENGPEGVDEGDKERRRGILNQHVKQVALAKERWEKVNAVKAALIEEDKAVIDKDGRRQRRFNEGIEGHDKRRYAMRSRMARACHYTIYHAKRSHNYRIEREKLIADPQFQKSQALLEATMQRAEGYLKGPIDEDSGERFWKMHASRSWWTKIPEGPLGSPPSP